MIGRRTHARAFFATGLALAGLAWLLLWAWAESPWGRYLDHGNWTQIGLVGSVCAAIPWGESLVPGGLYVAGWVLMLAAMMLPTTLPVLHVLDRLASRRRDRGRLLAVLIGGYLAVWAGFGLVAHGADLALAAVVRQSAWATFNGWAIGAIVLAGAGLFQFSALKRRCLDRCRTPVGLVMQHWRGRRPGREALRLGLWHGAFCVGCCWAIMLLMFVVGTGNVGWMLALGLVMATEKNFAWGRRLSDPLGLGLIGWAAWIVAVHVWPVLALA
jgi:predicted metal-binding membrane protein